MLAKQGWRLITKQLKWVPPDGEVLKINIDAAFHAEELRGGTGVVVRNNSGLLIRAQALWYKHVANAMTMEAYAIRDAVILAMEQGYHKVAVESDAQSLALWEEDHGGRSEVAVIFQKIRELCGVFTSFCISYVRDANEASHLCAKNVNRGANDDERRRCLWLNFIPHFLAPVLQHDCSPTT
jgi:hypothetical protein